MHPVLRAWELDENALRAIYICRRVIAHVDTCLQSLPAISDSVQLQLNHCKNAVFREFESIPPNNDTCEFAQKNCLVKFFRSFGRLLSHLELNSNERKDWANRLMCIKTLCPWMSPTLFQNIEASVANNGNGDLT